MAGWPTLVVVVALALFAAVSNAETQGKMMTKISTSFFSILFFHCYSYFLLLNT
jgi:hypothetical protein